jgi:hypothetical protein
MPYTFRQYRTLCHLAKATQLACINPNNKTGGPLSLTEWERLLWKLAKIADLPPVTVDEIDAIHNGWQSYCDHWKEFCDIHIAFEDYDTP